MAATAKNNSNANRGKHLFLITASLMREFPDMLPDLVREPNNSHHGEEARAAPAPSRTMATSQRVAAMVRDGTDLACASSP
jgi:hypothetical protein